MILQQLILLVALASHAGIQAYFEFNNVQCRTMDPTFLSFQTCILRSVNRTYKYLSIRGVVHQLPIDNGWISMKVLQHASKNILERYAISIDVCKFLKERSNPMANLLFSMFEEYSNINHSCPYNEDLILDKLPVNHLNNLVKYLIPDGQYILNASWFTDNIRRAIIVVYFSKH